MPPSRHSSSSHSSSSHSSSHSSSSRSHGSSFGSSSRSYSSYSSPGRSSYPRSGPSGHSSTSRGSRPSYSAGVRRPSAPPNRPRVNQPTGFAPGMGRPQYLYGRRHDYVYYPVAWTDSASGTQYEKGYYDENGQRYEDVAFEKNGRYENVVCHCAYCGQDSLVNLDADKLGAQALQCPYCGAPTEIRSLLDQAVSGAPEPQSAAAAYGAAQTPKKKKRVGLIVAVVLLALALIGRVGERLGGGRELQESPVVQNSAVGSNTELFGETIALSRGADGAYVPGGGTADKLLVWSAEDESYYDAQSDCWLWYNTDVEPPVWQYWYEGISSDFGDYGWMEHDETGWYIEASYGEWIALPAQYDAGGLWYIAD